MNNTATKRWYKHFLLLACLIANVSLYGQDLIIHPTYNNMYGGGSFEEVYSTFETADGDFMIAGKAIDNPTLGNLNDPFCGSSDFWLIKTDADGNTVWDSLYGGIGNESLYETIQTADGGFVSIGITNSDPSCEVPPGNPFVNDGFILKTDVLGNVLWSTRTGAPTGDQTNSIIETSDGHILFGGTQQNAGGNDDFWIVKLDGTTGAVMWQNTIGGSEFDILKRVRETSDGFFLGGFSNSGISGDKTTPHFGTSNTFDYWVVKTDLSGNFLWDRTYGGTEDDQLWDIELTPDGGLILGGFSLSDPAMVPANKTAPNIGSDDFWAVKIDAMGNIDWDQSYGGTDSDRIYSVDVLNVSDCSANYIFGGVTNSSADGDISNANQGITDYWIVFTDNSGNLIWENNYGGDNYDALWDFNRNADGSYILGGHTVSNNPGAPSDIPSPNFGIFDNWVFKLICNFDVPDQADMEICEGESITISAVTGDCPSCTYQWDANGNSALTNSITVNPTDTTTYTVIVTNATCCTDTTSITINTHPSPTVDLGPDTEICPGEIIPLDASTTGCTYFWSTGSTDPNIDVTMAGTYTVTVTCGVAGCTDLDEIVVDNFPLIPPINISAEICQGDSLFVGGNWQFSSGNYTDTLMSIDGCDSIIITELNIESVYEITLDSFSCNTNQIGLDTLPLMSQSGCDSLIIYNIQLTELDSFFFENFTCDSNLVDTLIIDAPGMNGECDSILVNITSFAPAFETYIDTTTCSLSEVGLDTLPLVSQFGCDSIIIFDFQLVQIDSFFFENFTCDSNLVDTLIIDAQGVNGECDSILVNITSFAPAFETYIDTTTCSLSEVGLDTLPLVSQFGCDSIIIFDFQLVQVDSFFFENFTCDSNLVDTLITDSPGMNGECDSILVNITSFAPAFETYIDTTTCSLSEVGLDTLPLVSQFGCDSIIIFDFQLVQVDSFFFENFTCDSNLVDTLITDSPGMNGECDSILVNITSLAPTYEIFVDTTTCSLSEVGLDTIPLVSQFGCDSIIIFDFQFIENDTITVEEMTCDSNLVGTTTTTLPGMNGECDSILITNTVFGCDTIFIIDLSCNPIDTGIFIQNNGGVITVTNIDLAPSDSTYLTNTSCNPLDTGLIQTAILQNQFGCDSTIFTYTSLLPPINISIQNTTCDISQTGIFIDSLQNQFGCDSIVTNTVTLQSASIDSILTTSCFFDEVGIDTLFEGLNSAGCDSLVVSIVEFEQELEVFISISEISCFGESDGAILIDSVVGGTGPYLYSLNFQPFQNAPFFTNLSEGDYSVLIEDAEGCQTFVILPLLSTDELIVDLGDDLFITLGDSATIFAQINISESEIDTIMWSPYELTGCNDDCLNFLVTPTETTTFSLMVIDNNGCLSQDFITIYVDDNIPVFIPNAFSPNEDNQNDRFTIFGNEALIEEVQVFRIFDRWGELVFQHTGFQPNDPSQGWDGKLDGEFMNPAVFVYYAEVRFIDGTVKRFEGDVTLMR